ncbi:YciI family protein [Streptomyces violens]|uniref:YciI family protein n=1 Tax=Streptomyces violens TaxID=66377 RepID=UPI0004C29F2A|nr:YciI family protein [Streptomyces violens]
MKYMLMIQASQADYDAMSGKDSGKTPWTEGDLKAMFQFMESLNNDLAENGEMIDGQGLSEPAQARVVTPGKDGVPVVADGPYGETKEVLCGYWVLDCASLDRATEIAKRILQCPVPEGAENGPVTIRSIPDNPPCEV